MDGNIINTLLQCMFRVINTSSTIITSTKIVSIVATISDVKIGVVKTLLINQD